MVFVRYQGCRHYPWGAQPMSQHRSSNSLRFLLCHSSSTVGMRPNLLPKVTAPLGPGLQISQTDFPDCFHASHFFLSLHAKLSCIFIGRLSSRTLCES